MGAHSPYGGSSAHRWTSCTASIHEIEKAPVPASTEYADEGSLAHEIAALALQGEVNLNGAGVYWNDMVKHAVGYKDYVKEVLGPVAFDSIKIEHRVDYSHIIPGGFGTVDAWGIIHWDNDRVLHVFDYKYGIGVTVSAEDNKQMLTYIIGILNHLKTAKIDNSFDRYVLHIYQPRGLGKTLSTWECTDLTIKRWEAKMYKSYDDSQDETRRKYVPSPKNCQFCPALLQCKAVKEIMHEVNDVAKTDNVQLDDIAYQIMRRKPFIIKYLSILESHILSLLQANVKIPGFVLGSTRPKRTYLKEAESLLEPTFGDKIFETKKKLLSISAMKKVIGDDLVEQVTFIPDGNPKVVAMDETELKRQQLKDEF